ncbi:hypothetical protein CDAR_453271 [Caerostris darwini]|uniref:Uncharacterized protein n=1 Tax=Caerostris darwini TaxID=1538125 RepID=A0AAV4RXI5_9ARAC|nr:hypothetical protein CDAR_453271 [Caerostris darwini]
MFLAIEINRLINDLQIRFFNAATTTQRNNSNSNRQTDNRRKKRNAIWWTRELEIKRSKTHALRRLYQKERNQQVRSIKLISYKKNLAEYKKMILTKKKEKFQEYIN